MCNGNGKDLEFASLLNAKSLLNANLRDFLILYFVWCFCKARKDRRCGLSLLVAYLTNARAVLLALNGRFFTPFFTLCFKIYANFAFLIKFLRIFSLNLVLSLSAE